MASALSTLLLPERTHVLAWPHARYPEILSIREVTCTSYMCMNTHTIYVCLHITVLIRYHRMTYDLLFERAKRAHQFQVVALLCSAQVLGVHVEEKSRGFHQHHQLICAARAKELSAALQ